jgi:hypothetical protein
LLSIKDITSKIKTTLILFTRARYKIAKTNIYEFLILGNLREINLQKTKTNQVAIYKSKLNSRASLQTSGSLFASIALERKKKKEVDTCIIILK